MKIALDPGRRGRSVAPLGTVALIALAGLLSTNCSGTETMVVVLETGPVALGRPQGVPPLLKGTEIDQASLAFVLDAKGQPRADVMQAYVAEIQALPLEQQQIVGLELSRRADLALAAITGLDKASGGPEALSAALVSIGANVDSRYRAAIAKTASTIGGPGAARHFVRSGETPPPTPGAIAVIGLFMGYMGVATAGATFVGSTNALTATANPQKSSDGLTVDATLGQVNVALEFNGTQDAVNVNFNAGAAIQPCPATDGTFNIEAEVDVKTSAGAVAQSASVKVKMNGTVNDNADLADKTSDINVRWSEANGGGTNQMVDYSFLTQGDTTTSRTNSYSGDVTKDFATLAAFMGLAVGMMIESTLVDAATKAWQSGRCVTLTATPSAGPAGLKQSAELTVQTEPRSKIDGSKTGGTVSALLSAGARQIDPSGTPLPADATFNYSGPDETNKQGTVDFEARSRRGIGKASITFSTSKPKAYHFKGGLQDFQVDQVVCDITQPFTLEAPGVGTAVFSGGYEGTYVATGVFNFHYEGTYVTSFPSGPEGPATLIATSGGVIAGQAGAGSEVYSLTPVEPCSG